MPTLLLRSLVARVEVTTWPVSGLLVTECSTQLRSLDTDTSMVLQGDQASWGSDIIIIIILILIMISTWVTVRVCPGRAATWVQAPVSHTSTWLLSASWLRHALATRLPHGLAATQNT